MITQGEARMITEETKRECLRALKSRRMEILTQTDDPLNDARIRGLWHLEWLVRDWVDDWSFISDAEASLILEISVEEVEEQRQAFQLIGVQFVTEDYLYPTWQFTKEGKLPGLEEVLPVLAEATTSPLMQAKFFLIPLCSLPDGVTARDYLLNGGDIERVVHIAENYLEQGWN